MPQPHPAGVERRDARGVDEPGPDPQPGEERRGQPAALAVEELVERGVGADGHDQRGALGVGEQQRDVLGGAAGGDPGRADAEPLEPVRAHQPVGGVGVQDHLTRGAQRLVGHGHPGRCRPAGEAARRHQDVGRQPGPRAGRRRRASTRDEHRALLADEARAAAAGRPRSRSRAPPRPPAGPAIAVAQVRARPRPWSSRSCSRRRNSVVLWVKLCSWVVSPSRASLHRC